MVNSFGQAFQAAEIDVISLSEFIIVDSFELGATVTERNQVLRHASTGFFYRWAGDLPKVVPPSSTPLTSGGLGESGWLLTNVQPENIYESLKTLTDAKNNFVSGKTYITSSFYAGQNKGYGQYVYMAGVSKAIANGGSIIDPDKMGSLTSTVNQAQLLNYLAAQGTGIGTGCLVKLGNIKTVEMYGGLPDIPTLNLRQVFINMCKNTAIPYINLLEGTYYVAGIGAKQTGFNMPSGTTIDGMGWFKSVIKTMNGVANHIAVLGSYGTEHVTLKNLCVDGNKQRSASVFDILGDGVDFDVNVRHATVENVWVRNALGEGLDVDSCTHLTVNNLLATDCGGNGLHISDPFPPRYSNVSNVVVINCSHGRGASGDARAGGINLRASNLNLNNIIVKDSFCGLLINGELVGAADRGQINITNLHIANSAREDIVGSNNASGFNISNFTIKRGNDYPTSIDFAIAKTSVLSNGEIEGSAKIWFRESIGTTNTGIKITDVNAPNCDLELTSWGSPTFRRSNLKVTSSEFKDLNLSGIYGAKFTDVSCNDLNINGGLHNSMIKGLTAYGNVNATVTTASVTRNIFAGSIVAGNITPIILGNTSVEKYGNIIGGIVISPPVNPTKLFEGGVNGARWKIDAPNTLFQDVAGLIPAVKDGDKVALMKDISGNGHHAVQSNPALRPTLRITAATGTNLRFSDVDGAKFIVPTFKPTTASTAVTVIVSGHATSANSPSRALVSRRISTLADNNFTVFQTGNYSTTAYKAVPFLASGAQVVSVAMSANSVNVRQGGVEVYNGTDGISQFNIAPLVIGGATPDAVELGLALFMYELIVVDALVETATVNGVEKFISKIDLGSANWI